MSTTVGIGASLHSIFGTPFSLLLGWGKKLRDIFIVVGIKLRAKFWALFLRRLQYNELRSNEVRLLSILPSRTNRADEPIRCTLHHVSLDHTAEYKAWEEQSDPQLRLAKKLLKWWEYALLAVKEKLLAAEPSDEREAVRLARETLWKLRQYTWGDYLALSYVWGSAIVTDRVIVNGQFVPVTENLASALLAAREDLRIVLGAGTIRLWADALCINQGDLLERGKEVRRMGSIYGNSAGVFVHVGPKSDDSELALALIRKIGRNLREGFDYRQFLVEMASGVLNGNSHPDQAGYIAVLKLLCLPYWSRTWILQELAMGCDDTSIHYGNSWVAIHEVRQVMKLFLLNIECITTIVGEDIIKKEFVKFQTTVSLLWWIGRLWDLTTLPTPRVSSTYTELRSPILYMAQYSRATDARDKVYGLLGLLPTELATKIDRKEQNYTLSTRQVFIDFAKAIIEVTGELDIIFARALQQDTLSEMQLPSWAPDWTLKPDRTEGRNEEWYFGYDERYAASGEPFGLRRRWTSDVSPCKADGGKRSHIDFQGGDSLLSCQGFCIGTITAFSAEPITTPDSVRPDSVMQSKPNKAAYSVASEVQKEEVQKALLCALLANPYGETANESIIFKLPWFGAEADADAKSLKFNFGPESDQMVLNLVEHGWDPRIFAASFASFEMSRRRMGLFRIGNRPLKEYFAQEVAPPPSSVNLEELNFTVANLAARRLVTMEAARTKVGHVGLGPATIEAGDEVFILLGSSRPVVLRPSKVDGHYKVVGDCYIDGFMTGEAVLVLETGESELQKVTLC